MCLTGFHKEDNSPLPQGYEVYYDASWAPVRKLPPQPKPTATPPTGVSTVPRISRSSEYIYLGLHLGRNGLLLVAPVIKKKHKLYKGVVLDFRLRVKNEIFFSHNWSGFNLFVHDVREKDDFTHDADLVHYNAVGFPSNLNSPVFECLLAEFMKLSVRVPMKSMNDS